MNQAATILKRLKKVADKEIVAAINILKRNWHRKLKHPSNKVLGQILKFTTKKVA